MKNWKQSAKFIVKTLDKLSKGKVEWIEKWLEVNFDVIELRAYKRGKRDGAKKR